MPSPGSPRNGLIDIMSYLLRKSDRPRTRLLLITVNDWYGNADQSGVGAVQAQRVINQVNFAPKFAGHYAAVRLVPIKDELLIRILAHNVQVDGDLPSVIELQLVNSSCLRLPTRAGQAVLRGVNAGARP